MNNMILTYYSFNLVDLDFVRDSEPSKQSRFLYVLCISLVMSRHRGTKRLLEK
nr:hypothetical protein Q903MT_gene3651 [Picea sitchensis]